MIHTSQKLFLNNFKALLDLCLNLTCKTVTKTHENVNSIIARNVRGLVQSIFVGYPPPPGH